MTPEDKTKLRIRLCEAAGPKLYVIRKPMHDPFGFYRPEAKGYTGSLAEAWKVTKEVAEKYICHGKAALEPDRVIMEPAPLLNPLESRDDFAAILAAQTEAVQIGFARRMTHTLDINTTSTQFVIKMLLAPLELCCQYLDEALRNQ